jgi:KDO2-lipid IV(A) lauroyltransferase
MKEKPRHLLEALLFRLAMAVFRLLPLDVASWLGGAILRLVGPRLRQHRVALVNLGIAFPEKTEAERRRIAHRMWENLGRVAAEFSHLPGNKLFGRSSFSGLENFPEPGRPCIFVSAHFGNWELSYPAAHEHGIKTTLVYRHFNNPYVDRYIGKIRRSHSSDMLPKGPKGATKMIGVLKRGESLAMLVDQKMNEGIPVPFFGVDAMTAPAIAHLALRYDMPILPARVLRTKGCHFKSTLYPPIPLPKTGNTEEDARAIMAAINKMFEEWIREHPEQWFWVHRRWAKELYG